MRKLNVAYWTVSLITIVGTIIFLIIAPSQVPIRWNFAGEVEGMGSKFVHMILPVGGIGVGVLCYYVIKHEQKKGQKINMKLVMIGLVIHAIFFTLLSFFIFSKALSNP